MIRDETQRKYWANHKHVAVNSQALDALQVAYERAGGMRFRSKSALTEMAVMFCAKYVGRIGVEQLEPLDVEAMSPETLGDMAAVPAAQLVDGAEALRSIFQEVQPKINGAPRSLSLLLAQEGLSARLADLIGIKTGVEGLMLAVAHKGLAQALRASSLSGADIKARLLTLPGVYVTDNPRVFGKNRHRAIVIPASTLEGNGIRIGGGGGDGDGDDEEPWQ